MKPTIAAFPEMAYAPHNPERNLLSADPVLGYRIYPQPPLHREGARDAPRASSSTPPSPTSPTAHRTRGRPHGKSAISSMTGSVSSGSGDSDRSYDGVIAYPAPVRTSRSSKPERLSNVSRRDVESSPTPFSDPFRSPVPVSMADVTAMPYLDEEEDEGNEEEVNSKALRLCIYLSGFCGLVSLMNMLWVFIAVIIALLLQPLRLCSFRQSFREELIGLLAPLLNMQLRFIYAPVTSENYNLMMLIVIHLFSPLLSIGVAVASWTAAFFWFYAALLGDPTKTDRKSDGKTTVLGVRAWWERWLRRGLR